MDALFAVINDLDLQAIGILIPTNETPFILLQSQSQGLLLVQGILPIICNGYSGMSKVFVRSRST
jgi:hypothetical protein